MKSELQKDDLAHYSLQSSVLAQTPLAAFERLFSHKARWYARFLKGLMPQDRDALVLDIPCGHGVFLWFATHAGYTNVRGYDVDPGRVEIARNLGLPAELGDVRDVVASLDGTVGLIACLNFIEHIEKTEVCDFLSACHRALRPGGVLLVKAPFVDSILSSHDLANDFTHKWAVNSTVYRNLFLQVGFKDVMIKDERPVPYHTINRIRLVAFHVAKALTTLYFRLLGLAPPRVWSPSGWVIGKKT